MNDENSKTEEPDPSDLCPLCYPNTEFVAMFAPNIAIEKGPKGYFLLASPYDHDDDLAYFGEIAPTPDPWPDFGESDDEEAEEAYAETPEGHQKLVASSAWLDTAEASVRWPDIEDPRSFWYLVEAFRKAGYDPQESGGLDHWVCHKAGLALQAAAKE